MIVVVQGEVLCEECSDSLGLASRSAAATGGAQLPENDGGGTLSALTMANSPKCSQTLMMMWYLSLPSSNADSCGAP